MTTNINKELHDNLDNITNKVTELLSELTIYRELCKTNVPNERTKEFVNLIKIRLSDNYRFINTNINELYEALDKINLDETPKIQTPENWGDNSIKQSNTTYEEYDDEIEEEPPSKDSPEEQRRKTAFEKIKDLVK